LQENSILIGQLVLKIGEILKMFEILLFLSFFFFFPFLEIKKPHLPKKERAAGKKKKWCKPK